ncbi:MAG: fatty acyl-AMP ligase [Planctomycetota bacterium]|nr:fatty acyl-AMP ligase [Planctomycetota bacterium]
MMSENATLHAVPETRTLTPSTLLELVESRAANDTCRFTVLSESGAEETRTLATLLEGAGRVAGAFRASGMERGDRFLLILPSSFDFLETFLGGLWGGFVPVPMSPPTRLNRIGDYVERMERIVSDSGARFIITIHELRSVLVHATKGLEPGAILTPIDLARRGQPMLQPVDAQPEETAFLQYTSGSTGGPKGVQLTHANLIANIAGGFEGLSIRSGEDIFVNWLPLFHDMGMIGCFLFPIQANCHSILMDPLTFLRHPIRWLEAIDHYRGTISHAPNFAYQMCASKIRPHQVDALDLSCWKVALIAAEPVLPETMTHFEEAFAPIGFEPTTWFPAYGLAEMCVGATYSDRGRGAILDRVDRDLLEVKGIARPRTGLRSQTTTLVGCGTPPSKHRIRIVDTDGNALSERKVGEVVLDGPSRMRGYFEQPETTANTIRDGWLHTGDLGYLAGGQLFIIGRAKDLIIRAGRNYYPQDIEVAAGRVEGVRPGGIAAVGISNAERGTEEMILLAETLTTDSDTLASMKVSIRKSISRALDVTPDKIVLLPPRTLPKTSSGKIQRSEAKRRYLDQTLIVPGLQARLKFWRIWLGGKLRLGWLRLRQNGSDDSARRSNLQSESTR